MTQIPSNPTPVRTVPINRREALKGIGLIGTGLLGLGGSATYATHTAIETIEKAPDPTMNEFNRYEELDEKNTKLPGTLTNREIDEYLKLRGKIQNRSNYLTSNANKAIGTLGGFVVSMLVIISGKSKLTIKAKTSPVVMNKQ